MFFFSLISFFVVFIRFMVMEDFRDELMASLCVCVWANQADSGKNKLVGAEFIQARVWNCEI